MQAPQNPSSQTLPYFPLRDVVIFPYMIFPVLIGRESSIQSVTKAIDSDKMVFVCTQRNPADEDPSIEDLYEVGCLARILQVLKLPNGLFKVLIEGQELAAVHSVFRNDGGMMTATVEPIELDLPRTTKVEALTRRLDRLFAEYVKINRNMPNETTIAYENQEGTLRKLFFIAANLLVSVNVKMQLISGRMTPEARIYTVIKLLTSEINVLKLEMEIDDKVHDNIQRSQRKFFLQEQIRVLQNELGNDDEVVSDEINDLSRKIMEAGMPEAAEEKVFEELDKLKRMPAISPEAAVSRNYIDVMVALPWSRFSEDRLSISSAREVLDNDHFGLAKPKERILEHIAVMNLLQDGTAHNRKSTSSKGQILCFVGPPGVGKTSLGRSIARALGRQFVRISLGGISDEAEIRGHRRTYIGSMPGKIVQAIRKAGTSNPVILLDEVDKLSQSFHGDPAAALLEVLDPEQNFSFNDHYLDVDYDLSPVMFITTANIRYSIPPPLQDRMEIIELPGYLEHEKVEITKRHLLPRLLDETGLAGQRIKISDKAILDIIREYTMEAGVRNLERNIASILRKIAREVVEKKDSDSASARKAPNVGPADLATYLGVPRYRRAALRQGPQIGSATGLAWTNTGGDVLAVGVSIMKGRENLRLTGQLGDVMKESAQAALSYLRTHCNELGIPDEFFEKKEIHIHIPEGAIPKDGPSAGVTMSVAMLSAIRRIGVPSNIGMTGEITLHGRILPIGGLTEKLLAAKRHRLTTILIPIDNKRDLTEIPDEIRAGLEIIPVKSITEVLPVVFPKAFKEIKKK